MIELATNLVIHMYISLIYTEFVFGDVLCNAEKRKIHTGKTVYGIIRDILLDEGIWGEIKIDMSSDRKAYESFYVEKSRTIQLSDAEETAQAIGTAIHECGHAIQYNKSVMMKKVIRVRDALKKFCLPDMVSPLAVLFFDGFKGGFANIDLPIPLSPLKITPRLRLNSLNDLRTLFAFAFCTP